MPLSSLTSRSLRKAPISGSRIIGAGEMAGLIRAFDWSKSVLGPVETWSDTLITTVNMLLASRHPMFLWWGPDLIQFYNDGYRPSLRADKHPSAVGQQGIECWPEIWSIIGPQIQAVMERGESSWNANQLVPIKRNGKLEEVFWTYSYSPVRDKNGSVQGVLVVCSETTEQVLSERRLRALLAISAEIPGDVREPEPLLAATHNVMEKLDDDPADIPFAMLFTVRSGKVITAGHTRSATSLQAAQHWPVEQVASSGTARLVELLSPEFGTLVLPPWPEPVTRAYALPLAISDPSTQMVMVFGLSPRLPFDDRYVTFLQLVGARVATLLDAEMHLMERTRAAERFRRLSEANPFGTVIGDLHGGIKYVNPMFLKALGYSEADVRGSKLRWDQLTPPEYKESDSRALKQLRESGRCEVYEKAYLTKDGRRIPILIGAATLDSQDRDPEVAAFMTDLTPLRAAEEALRRANDELEKKVADRTKALESEIADRKRAEDNLRELTGRLLRTQDEERRYMARELHDHAGQTLVALILNLALLQDSAANQLPEFTKVAAESQKLSEDLSREIRTLSYLLHPPLLDEAGLGSALRWYVNGFSERSKIKVDLELPDDLGRLPNDLELVVFRVVQESLTNVHRHSESASARIRLGLTQSQLELEIVDYGKGISPERQHQMTAAHVGVGVRGMEERVRQFHGKLKIESDLAGTRVIVTLPIETGTK
jgi:PAS domain S-box-containing protein